MGSFFRYHPCRCSELANPEEPKFSAEDELIESILQDSKAKSTIKKYTAGFNKWKNWCEANQVVHLPAKQIDIARFFSNLHQRNVPYSQIESIFYGIKWHYDRVPDLISNPCDSKYLHLILQGLKRRLAKPVLKKLPVSCVIISSIVAHFGSPFAGLADLRVCLLFLLAYAGFFRYDELANIRRCDVDLYLTYFKVLVRVSKTDQYREGAWVVISKTDNSTCPMTMLLRYFKAAGLDDPSDQGFIFRPLVYCPKQKCHRLRSGQMSYSRCREIFKDALVTIGVDPKPFGLHSLRAGGATAAANAGVGDRLFKRHGRWRSESAKDGYVEDSLANRLFVSQNLGL